MRRTVTSIHLLVWRQIRFSTLVMAALLAFVVRVGLSSFNLSGGVKGMVALRPVIENPAVSALYGRVSSLANAGAFVEWKMGMFMALAVAMWGALLATRVTRASEDEGTWDLVVASRVGRQPALVAAVRALLEACLLVGLVVFVSLISGSQAFLDSLLYAVGFVGMSMSGVGIGLVCSQLFAPRRSATQVALSVIGLFFIIRVLADGAVGNEWLRWFSPFGWLENLGAFHHRSAWWILSLVVVPLGASVTAWRLQRHRDIGSAWWTRSDRTSAHVISLRSPWRFAWRERRGMLVAWSVGLATLGLVVGYLTNALVELCRTDRGYVKLLKHWGLGSMVSGRGFIAEACLLFAVALSFMVAALLVSIGTDSYEGRLDLPLAYGASRFTWLTSGVVMTVVATFLIAMLCALAAWLGVVVSGTSMGVTVPLEGMLNALSVVPWLVGVSVLLLAILPRFSYLVIAMLLSVLYIVAVPGPVLAWPSWLLDASPFFHLHLVPTVATNWGATFVLSAIGLVLGTAGYGVFTRRDVGH